MKPLSDRRDMMEADHERLGRTIQLEISQTGTTSIRTRNSKRIRHAGCRTLDGVIGDPEEVKFTEHCMQLGWRGRGSCFDLFLL